MRRKELRRPQTASWIYVFKDWEKIGNTSLQYTPLSIMEDWKMEQGTRNERMAETGFVYLRLFSMAFRCGQNY